MRRLQILILALMIPLMWSGGCASGKKTHETTSGTRAAGNSATIDTAPGSANSLDGPRENPAERRSRCVLNKDQRELWLERKTPAGCVLRYRKFGQVNNLGESDIDTTYCRRMQAKIVGNLTASGFTCTTASGAKGR
jgi:hypothetical protein